MYLFSFLFIKQLYFLSFSQGPCSCLNLSFVLDIFKYFFYFHSPEFSYYLLILDDIVDKREIKNNKIRRKKTFINTRWIGFWIILGIVGSNNWWIIKILNVWLYLNCENTILRWRLKEAIRFFDRKISFLLGFSFGPFSSFYLGNN